MNSLLPPETPSNDWTHAMAIYVNICESNCCSLNPFFRVVALLLSLCVLNSMLSWPSYSLAREVLVGNISFEQTFTDLAARPVLQNHLASTRDVCQDQNWKQHLQSHWIMLILCSACLAAQPFLTDSNLDQDHTHVMKLNELLSSRPTNFFEGKTINVNTQILQNVNGNGVCSTVCMYILYYLIMLSCWLQLQCLSSFSV